MKHGSLLIPLLLEQPADGTPYRPSNGTEGSGFTEGLCANCKADRAFRENPDQADGCPLLANSLAFNVNEPGYPKEWIWKDGEPTRTAFDDVELQITNEERAAQMPLFA